MILAKNALDTRVRKERAPGARRACFARLGVGASKALTRSPALSAERRPPPARRGGLTVAQDAIAQGFSPEL